MSEAPEAARDGPSTPLVRPAATIQPERVVWRWRGRIAAATMALLDGDPGLGKSTLVADIVARTSRGEPLPGDAIALPAAGAILVSFEDAAGPVIVPRLIAAGADLARVFVWDLDAHPFALPGSLAALEALVRRHRVGLVVIDPLMAALAAEVDAHRDQDVRRALSAVSAMAHRTGAAVLCVRHLNKTGSTKAIYRGGGSIGIVGAARSALLVERDPGDHDACVLAVAKCNVGREAPALRFRVVSTTIAEGIETSRIEWLGTVETSADELVAEPAERGVIEAATRWLAQALATGPMPATAIANSAGAAGISERTLRRAKKRLGVVVDRPQGAKGPWIWSLPKGTSSP